MIEIGDSIVPREASDTERHRGVIPRFALFIFHAPSFGMLAASACATKMHFCGNGAGRSRSPTMQFFSARSSSNRKMLDLATRHLLLALGLDPVSPSKPPSLRRPSWLLGYKRLLATVSN
jgi:hypothetical protein